MAKSTVLPKSVPAAIAVLGAALLVCGLPMLLVPSKRERDVQRYNDAAIKLMESPPLAFVPSERLARGLDPYVVGTVSSVTQTANLTIVEDRGSSSRAGDGPWGAVVGARWYLAAELNLTLHRTVRDGVKYETVLERGLTFAFGNVTFDRAFPFQAISFDREVKACTFEACDGTFGECIDDAMRRCTSESLARSCQSPRIYFWSNFTGRSECFSGDICGECTRYAYPTLLCTVVDVAGSKVAPNAQFESCYYPFDTTPNIWRIVDGKRLYEEPNYWNSRLRWKDETRSVRIVVLPSTDPTLIGERVTDGRGFAGVADKRPTVGLVFVIAGAVIISLDFAVAFLLHLRRRRLEHVAAVELAKVCDEEEPNPPDEREGRLMQTTASALSALPTLLPG